MQYVAKFGVPLACASKKNGVAELSSLQSAGKHFRRHVRDVYVDDLINEELHHQACISNQEIIDKYLIFQNLLKYGTKAEIAGRY